MMAPLAGALLAASVPAHGSGLPERIEVALADDTTVTLRLVPAGEFAMGSPPTEVARFFDEGPVTIVRITRAFYLGETEVTQAQWNALMPENPSLFRGPEVPVGNISRDDANAFAAAAGKRTGLPFRLPTEAEWQYACRAGTSTRYSFGDDEEQLDAFAWHDGNAGGRLHAVGQKAPNPWGFFDMHGNAWEWMGSGYDAYPGGTVADWAPPPTQPLGLLKPGVWYVDDFLLRSATRSYWPPFVRDPHFGMRLAMDAVPLP
jgi:formylglycine-generating enzyme required for sulfatase activity